VNLQFWLLAMDAMHWLGWRRAYLFALRRASDATYSDGLDNDL
jgi:hypothetical protein